VTRRLVLGYVGVVIVVLLALALPLGFQHQQSEHHDLTAKVQRDANVLARYAEDAVQNRQPAQLADVARSARAYADDADARVSIVDKTGRLITDTGVQEESDRHALTVAAPIGSGGRVYGTVRIAYPTDSVDAHVRNYWFLLAAICAAVLVASAVLGFRLARFVARPLLGLERAAEAVGEGKLDTRASETDGPPEVRSLARALNETVAKLEQIVRSQEEFIADASHELRTPLTALRLRLENGDVEGALNEAERLTDLVSELLALARADATPAEIVDASAVARERVEHWRAFAAEQDVTLEVEADRATLARVAPARLAQVLDNLLANALDVAPAQSTVTVAAAAHNGHVEVCVTDEVPGMTAEERARAFDRFWGKGSGLGLAIVRKLLATDEGEVELGDAPGGGLEAIVRLRSA